MRIYALIPGEYLKEAEEYRVEFKMDASIGKNDSGDMTLILTVKDENGKTINGTQYIANLVLL